jgi:hypothetical protein
MRARPSAPAAILTALLLSGCGGSSAGGPAPLNGALASRVQTAALEREARPVAGRSDAAPAASCPYSGGCYAVDKGNPVTFQWCISTTGNCTSGLDGNWTWTAVVTDIKTGKVIKPGKGPVSAVWSPDPGNPSTLTVSTDFKHLHEHPKVLYSVTLSTCEVSGSQCFPDFVVYGIEN